MPIAAAVGAATAVPMAAAVGGVSVVTVAAGRDTGHALAAVLGAPCAVNDGIDAEATATVGGLLTIAEAMAAAVGAATAVPIAAAVGGVKVVIVAVGRATGTDAVAS